MSTPLDLANDFSKALSEYSATLEDSSFARLPGLFRNSFRPIILERARSTYLKGDYDAKMFHTSLQEVHRYFSDLGYEDVKNPVYSEYSNPETENTANWLKSVKDYRSGIARSGSSSAPRMPYATQKVEIKFSPYDGTVGKAAEWWASTRSLLCDLPGDSEDPKVRSTWCSMIKSQLLKKPTKLLFDQLKRQFTGAANVVDTDKLMKAFIDKHDLFAEEACYRAWEKLRQKEPTKQSILDFSAMFIDRAEELNRHGFGLTDHQKWIAFKTKVFHSEELQKASREVSSIEQAVEYLTAFEGPSARRSSINAIRNRNGKGRKRGRSRSGKGNRDGDPRCHKCHRTLKYHDEKGVKFGTKECPYPKKSLKEQLEWESKNNVGGKSSVSAIDSDVVRAAKKAAAEAGRTAAKDYVSQVEFTCNIGEGSKGTRRSVIKTDNGSASSLRRVSMPDADDASDLTIYARMPPDAACVSTGNGLMVPVFDESSDDSDGDVDGADPAVGNSVNRIRSRSEIKLRSPLRLSKKEGVRKICMTYLRFETNSSATIRKPALWDTGSNPDSYISRDVVHELGLSDRIVHQKQRHTQAGQDSSFVSIGTIDLVMVFAKGHRVQYPFKVADIGTEVILGWDLLDQLGAIISLPTKKIMLKHLGKIKLNMITVSEWSTCSRITSLDFLRGEVPLPSQIQKSFPGKSLLEIAEILDRLPAEDDLTVEQGRKIINDLLSNEYKIITKPRSTPTPYVEPGRIDPKEGYEDVVVNVPPRSHPSLHWDAIHATIEKWLKTGKMEKSSSPFNSPFVVAPKKTAPFFRIAIDYRRLNSITKPYKFPLRRLDEMCEELSAKRYKSTIDMDQAYTQIPIFKPHRMRTAVTTRKFGKVHFVCFPYGLVISGDIFCERKHKAFSYRGGDVLLWRFVWTYVDDDACGTNSVICHIFIICVVFDRFVVFGFAIQPPKCKFLETVVKYGGYLVGHREVRPNPKKVLAIQVFETPKNMKQLRNFLGICSWTIRRFHPAYAEHASRITTAFRKPNDKKKFSAVWEEQKLMVPFQKLKDAATLDLSNSTFDPDADDTRLYFDWSRWAICCVLMQNAAIVRVYGKACSTSESKCHPTKGEALAFAWAQRKCRRCLLSVKSFVAVTDNRPLMKIEQMLDVSHLDPMFGIWRTETEQYASRRTLVHVMGDKNLADVWTRIWPHKRLDVDVGFACAVSSDEEFYRPNDEDLVTLSRLEEVGYKVDRSAPAKVRVFIQRSWRIFVPKRSRARLLFNLHLPKHHGENAMKKLLSEYYLPSKSALLKDFLRSCTCSVHKSEGNPLRESARSRGFHRKIEAKSPYDIVQLDVFKFKDVHYLTAIDVCTGFGYCKPICPVKAPPRTYTWRMQEAYLLITSAFPKPPGMIVCDNENSLTSLPHPNIRSGAVDYPQGQGKVERMHKELQKLCGIHNITPDKAIAFYNADRSPVSGGGGMVSFDMDPVPAVAEVKADEDEAFVPYDGRVIEPGTLVFLRKPTRAHTKGTPWWHRLSKVISRVGRKSYLVRSAGGRTSKRVISKLKIFSIGEGILKLLTVNPEAVRRAHEYFSGSESVPDVVLENFQEFIEPAEDNAGVVWIGFPGLDQMNAVAGYVRRACYEEAFVIVPDIRCEFWYDVLSKHPHQSEWFAIPPDDDLKLWVSTPPESDVVHVSSIVWWIVKFHGKA